MFSNIFGVFAQDMLYIRLVYALYTHSTLEQRCAVVDKSWALNDALAVHHAIIIIYFMHDNVTTQLLYAQ